MRFLLMLFLMLIAVNTATANNLVNIIAQNKPSVVGIGVYTPTGRPQNSIQGTGFVIGNGQFVVTNYHVISSELDDATLQERVIYVGSGPRAEKRKVTLVANSKKHDLAVLKISGASLPALKLASDVFISEGSEVAFTGFPIGAVLGLYPVTHRGIIASVTPTVTPVDDSRQISIQMLKRMRDPYMVYQLDATAYPGNSGSALYEIESGQVVGIINKVFVQQTKEGVISNPSGITYAIPVKYLLELLNQQNIAF